MGALGGHEHDGGGLGKRVITRAVLINEAAFQF